MISALAFRCAPLLRHLADRPADGVREIERRAGLPKANVSRDLKALVAEDLIEAGSHELTAAGRSAIDALARLESPTEATAEVVGIPHALILPDPLNARSRFDEAALAALADSIAEHGKVLQNLLVRPAGPEACCAQPMHRLIAGERRWRAIAMLIRDGRWPADRPLPCRIIEVEGLQHELLGLAENEQRENLTDLERGRFYKRLQEAHGLSTAEIATRVNRSQRYVQQRLQLLTLPPIKIAELEAGAISFDAARQWLEERGRQEARARAAAADPKPATPTPLEARIAEVQVEQAAQEIVAALSEAPAPPTPPDVGAQQPAHAVRSASDALSAALAKVKAAADGLTLGAAATLSPRECAALVAELERLERRAADDHELSRPIEADDEELPGFLRRLAGAEAQP